jgi:GNAT superfamily N-acetyltransferase
VAQARGRLVLAHRGHRDQALLALGAVGLAGAGAVGLRQVAAVDGETCAGVTGFWIGNKLWCGKYLEIDNFVVAKAFRSQGIGKAIIDYLKQKAVEENCSMVALDSYTTNFKAHKLFYNEGFGPKGFHFIHVLRDDALR